MGDKVEPILLDMSVWIDAFTGRTPEIIEITKKLIYDDRVLTCGPVMFEIKRGLRPSERKKVLPLLNALIRLSVDERLWDSAGELDASLHNKGVTIPPMDVLIAQICLRHKVFLFSLDKHFNSVPGLRLFTAQEV